VSPLVGLAAAAVIGGSLAYLTGLPILKLRGHYLAMATLGVGIIVFVWLRGDEGLHRRAVRLAWNPAAALGDFIFTRTGSSTTCVGLCSRRYCWIPGTSSTPPGSALPRHPRQRSGGRILGVDVARFKLMVFVLSAVYAAWPVPLRPLHDLISPQPFGFSFSVRLVVNGGESRHGDIWGAISAHDR